MRKVSLETVRKFYPKITSVVDAKEAITVEVTKKDINPSSRRDHRTCAMAAACKRMFDADAAIIGIRSAYIIYGTKAIRFRVPVPVKREIVAFDQKGVFHTGDYMLRPPHKGERIGEGHSGKTHNPSNRKTGFVHHPEGIRTSLTLRKSK